MSKVYLQVTLNVIVESDSDLSTDDIMERLDFSVTDDGEGIVDVIDTEVETFHVTDSK